MAALREAHARGERKQLRDLRADLPETLVQVVECATEHDPKKRYQTAGELEHALAAASGVHVLPAPADAGLPQVDAATARVRPGVRALLWTAAALVALLAAALAIARWLEPAPAALTARFTVGPPYTTGSWPRLSPDGRLIVFGTMVQGRNRFWIRALDSTDGHPLMSTTANETPFWSPDSRTLAFFADGKLKRIPVDGGEPETLADAPQPHGGDWIGNRLLFAARTGIFTVAPDGTQLTAVTTLDQAAGDFQHAWPRFLPDGRRFLFVIRSSPPGADRRLRRLARRRAAGPADARVFARHLRRRASLLRP